MNRLIDCLTVIAWNVYIGTTSARARKALRDMIILHNPEIFGLIEAKNLYGDLHGLGYQVVQLKPRPLRKGNQEAQANVAILVRNDIRILRRFALRMRTFWRGPKHGWAQDPRVYRWIRIKWQGRVWKIGVAHTPFGAAARLESNNRLMEWFKRTAPGRPTVLLLDANMLQTEFEKKVADSADAEVTGHRIDLAAFMNVNLIAQENLGKGISDHPAMKYVLQAQRRK